ncbi:MAG: helix-turn-helix domain-containing protein [Hydrogenophaga sp.]|jgi:AraC family transcriptional regulator of adaptative response / DNA-3-methyladenine glycosylase II|nr:helix-turn-helix domain-containing protein [Hydrogenophaga sp.]
MDSMHRAGDDDARYRAVCSHDARFDGRFFVAVTSTGIYCRPVCRVRTPRRDNCRFFEHAAQAEHAGFRPCLRCRPELAPLDRHWSAEDAAGILVQQATHWLDDPRHWSTPEGSGGRMSALADRLGVSDRHLRRVFETQLGVSPLQALLTRQLLAAKQLLTDTSLPVAQVALASGFASTRRFNAAFQSRYGLNPTQLRRTQDTHPQHHRPDACRVKLSWRPPLDAAALLGFMATRHLPGLEQVDPVTLSLQRTVRLQSGGRVHTGWLAAQFDVPSHRLLLQVSDQLHSVLPDVIWRVRALFDLDADPAAINQVLHAHFPTGDGLRVPGVFDGFELAVRAVLGQQITVAAARTLAVRLLDRFGESMETPIPGLHRLFPSAEVLAAADPASLGELGIVRQRQAAIQALARAVTSGELDLNAQADPLETVRRLEALPGIGPWTAQYIAMRALRWPDAWLVGDVALHQALGLDHRLGAATRHEAARLAAAWQPWRSYATVRAWAGCHTPTETSTLQETHP